MIFFVVLILFLHFAFIMLKEEGENSMNLKEKIHAIPIIKQPLLYLGVVISFLLALFLLPKTNKGLWLVPVWYSALLIFTVTIGFKEFGPLYHQERNFFNLMKQTINIFFMTLVSNHLLQLASSINNPQQLQQHSYSFSWSQVVYYATSSLFVGIGEEIFKVCIFFFFYWALVKISTKRFIPCLVSVIITSFIFGALHSHYNPDQWLDITILIGGQTVLYFYFLLKYQTIIPLMLAHALWDFMIATSLSFEINYQAILSLIFCICVIRSSIDKRRNRKKLSLG